MRKQTIIFILISTILLPFVFSFSLTPGHRKIYFEPGLKTTVSFTVDNYDGSTKVFELVPSTKSSDVLEIIDQIVHIEEQNVIIEKGKKHSFSADIILPDNLSYGRHEIFINIFGNEPGGGGMIGVRTLLAFKVIVISRYPGIYVDGYLLGITAVNIGEVARLRTSVSNLGSEDIKSIRTKVDIYNGSKYIESVYSSETSLPSKTSNELVALLSTEDYPIGEYNAKAIIEYDGMVKNASRSRILRIGELFIDLVNISSRKFGNNKINKFDIIVESKWNRPADVYADVIVNDILGEEKAKFRTQSTTINGWEAGRVPAYFDVHNIENGKYKLKAVLNYEEKTTEKEFDIEIAESGEAEIVEEMPGMPKTTLIIIIQGAVILLLIIVGLIFFFRKKSKSS